jgi:hypothetical protein
MPRHPASADKGHLRRPLSGREYTGADDFFLLSDRNKEKLPLAAVLLVCSSKLLPRGRRGIAAASDHEIKDYEH